MGTVGFFLGLKLPGFETERSLPSTVAVKNVWSYTSTSPLSLHGVDRDNSIFLSLLLEN